MNFPTSTHKGRWLLSEEELETRRRRRYDKSVQDIERYGAASTSKGAGWVSMEEEKQLFSYYERMISKICVLFRMPRKILAISIVYFKRFYLKFSILDYDPWTVMITCVYLACKVENAYVSAEEIAKGVQRDARVVEKIVLGSEMNLLQGLDFDLVVHTPYASLNGYLTELKDYAQDHAGWDCDRAEDLVKALGKKGNESIDALLFSDGPLIFAPGVLAYAALEVGMKVHGKTKDVKAFLDDYIGHLLKKSGMGRETLQESIRGIHRLGEIGSKGLIEEQRLKEIDRKLKMCRNPVYDPSSDQYKKQQAEKQKLKQQAKANLKRSVAQDARALGMSSADEDFFFPESNQESKRRRSKETAD